MMFRNRGSAPVLLRLRSSAPVIVTTASFAVFTDIFLYSVIVPVFPFSLSERAGVPEDKVQYWLSISLAVYGAALLAASPIWGHLADRIQNRRIPMLLGLIVLAGSTVLLCLSVNLAMLLAGRILQGISGALTWTVGLALVIDTVDRKHVGRALGWIGTATSVGILIGPLLGGLVYARGGYYEVFAMCFGLLAVDIALRLFIIEVKTARQWIEVDVETVRQAAQAASSPNSAAGEGESDEKPARGEPEASLQTHQQPQTRPQALAAPSISAFGSLLSLLRKPRLLAALWGTLIQAVVTTAFDSTLPLLVSSIFGWDSIGGGLVFLPLIVPCFLSPLVGAVSDKYGSKWLATVGFLLATPFLVCLRFAAEDTLRHKVMLCGLLAGVGVAIALVFGPLMAEISWAVQADNDTGNGNGAEEQSGHTHDSGPPAAEPYALAYGLYNMAWSGGAILGPIMGGLIRESAGWGAVGWSLAIVMFVTAITQVIWIGGTLGLGRRKGTA